ncbi:MAG: rRNA maturation RNase YbeY [Crocosphaera sp.]|nr:rRNA maturation RNase YbeY [Crocosphaera sp.]
MPYNITAETWEKWFQSWGQSLIDDLPKASSYEVTLRLTNDAEIQHLNAQYRHKNQPTDVLAFATLDSDFPLIADEEQASEPLYLGDIVISVETAKEQAAKHNQVLGRELPWLAVHGFLHLLGWDHPDEPSLEAMLQQQETLLKKVGL